jgi:nucleoside transporter
MSQTLSYEAVIEHEKNSPATIAVLSVMMFLQYAVWGVWLPYMATYMLADVAQGGLGFTLGQMGTILGLAGSIGAVTAPFIAGQVADRIMNAERALAILLILGGVVNVLLAYATSFNQFLVLATVYSILYMPTLSLSNSIAFANLKNSEKTFPPVRLWGTVGWVVASTAFSFAWLASGNAITDTTRISHALIVSGAMSVVYALFALVALPKTPPKKDGNSLAFVKAFGLLKNPAFLSIVIVALPIAMIHQCYFFRAAPFFESIGVSKQYLGLVLGVGQASEIFFLLIVGLILQRVGFKGLLMLGAAAYALRFGLFSIGGPKELMIAAQVLHGLCYGCLFAGSFMLVAKIAGSDFKHSAQTVFGIVILGLGPILAMFYNSWVSEDFGPFWMTQAAVAAVSFVLLLVLFPKKIEAAT